jgi:hypothetical protein
MVWDEKMTEAHISFKLLYYEKFKTVMFTIPPISIKSTITSHLNSLNKKGGTTTYDVRNLGPGLGPF